MCKVIYGRGEMKYKAPIALFVYNRLAHLKNTIKALEKNEGALESELFIFSDGPRIPDDESRVVEVRKYIRTIGGFKAITIVEQENNLGLADSIISGVTKILENYSSCIIVEDDLVTSPNFLNFMNEGLVKYRSVTNVASIHGYVYPAPILPTKPFFLRGADCWGWATWNDRWMLFEKDANILLTNIEENKLKFYFNFFGTFPFYKMLLASARGEISSWAIRWNASIYVENMLTLYPPKSLVSNIGNDGSGTHSEKSQYFNSEMIEFDTSSLPDTAKSSVRGKFSFALYFLLMRIKRKLKL